MTYLFIFLNTCTCFYIFILYINGKISNNVECIHDMQLILEMYYSEIIRECFFKIRDTTPSVFFLLMILIKTPFTYQVDTCNMIESYSFSFFYAKTLNLYSPKTRIFLRIEELFDMYMYNVLEQVLFIKIFHFSFYFSWHYHKMMTYCFKYFPF